MQRTPARLVGVELYFDDLQKARTFYEETLGLPLTEELRGHHAQFEGGGGFVCLERKGAESYTSKDKAALFFEVADLQAAIASIGTEKFVKQEPTWAVLHDPEGYNILLLQQSR